MQWEKVLGKMGRDVMISPMVDIRRPELVQIGCHVGIDSFFVCSTQLKIGNYVHISPQVGVIGGKEGLFEMEDFTFLSLGCNIICGSEEFKGKGLIGPCVPREYQDKVIREPVIIKKYGGVCAGSTVLPGAVISEGTVIGANSLVLSGTVTDPWSIYAGSPIRKIGERPKGNIEFYADRVLTKFWNEADFSDDSV